MTFEKVIFFSNFVAFLQYLNFKKKILFFRMNFCSMIVQRFLLEEKHWAMFTLVNIGRFYTMNFSFMPLEFKTIANFLITLITLNSFMNKSFMCFQSWFHSKTSCTLITGKWCAFLCFSNADYNCTFSCKIDNSFRFRVFKCTLFLWVFNLFFHKNAWALEHVWSDGLQFWITYHIWHR